jgi:hypothetical protein
MPIRIDERKEGMQDSLKHINNHNVEEKSTKWKQRYLTPRPPPPRPQRKRAPLFEKERVASVKKDEDYVR